MSAAPVPFITAEEYLAVDRAADFRSEYFNGEVFAMSGGSDRHAQLISRLARELENALDDSPCRVTVSDLRLQISAKGGYFYPDVMVQCGDIAAVSSDLALSPSVVVEVLSPSTERWDRVGKFDEYRRLASLREYLLVSQDEMRIEWYTRRENGEWVYQETHGADGVCRLDVLGVSLSLERIYKKLGLGDATVRAPQAG